MLPSGARSYIDALNNPDSQQPKDLRSNRSMDQGESASDLD
jgi:hypothetical protein